MDIRDTEIEAHGQTPGVHTFIKWNQTDPKDGKIVIPFSFHKNVPKRAKKKIIGILSRMNDDLGLL